MSDALLLFTKPAHPGRVKTRLIGELTPEQAAEIHAAFRDDVCERLQQGRFQLQIHWALSADEAIPGGPVPGYRQQGADLGARLHHALHAASDQFDAVAAVGSDHPEITSATVEDAFRRLHGGADLVLGPVPDGGYFLIALGAGAVHRELFEDIAWSTETVLRDTLAKAEQLGLAVELLPEGHDIDRPDDLRDLVQRLESSNLEDGLPTKDGLRTKNCPRTRAVLKSWGRL